MNENEDSLNMIKFRYFFVKSQVNGKTITHPYRVGRSVEEYNLTQIICPKQLVIFFTNQIFHPFDHIQALWLYENMYSQRILFNSAISFSLIMS